MANLSERMEELIKKNGISYQEFADRVNAVEDEEGATLHKSFVSDVIKGNREPRYKTIVRIAKAFNVSTDYLLGVSDIPATLDEDKNISSKTTGLSIDSLKRLKEIYSSKGGKVYLSILNSMILSDVSISIDPKRQHPMKATLEDIKITGGGFQQFLHILSYPLYGYGHAIARILEDNKKMKLLRDISGIDISKDSDYYTLAAYLYSLANKGTTQSCEEWINEFIVSELEKKQKTQS